MADTDRDGRPSFQDEFPIPDHDEWRAAAVESLGGKPFEKLVTPSYEGIPIQPMYRREDAEEFTAAHTLPGQAPYVRGSRAAGYLAQPWAIAQELPYGSPAAFNRALRSDLEHGQTAVNLLLDGPTRAGKDPDAARLGEVGRGGVSLATVEDVAAALKGVDLSATPLFVRAGTVALPLLALLAAHLRRAGRPVADLHGCLEDDPLGALAHEGTLPLSLPRAYDEMAQLTRWADEYAPRLGTIAVHTYPYHNAGGNAVQELAFGLATAVAYVRALAERGVDIAVAARHVRFDFAVGGHFFMEVAKLRAVRLLWAQAAAAFGGDEEAQRLHLHARTARRNKTTTDPYVNLLRVTTEALAAAVGGVDSLHVAPFDEPLRPPDEFSRRIARNVQVILQEEAHLTEVIDPAGGAYAVEALTEALAREAWALFQEVERRGGMAAALQSGFVQAAVAAVAEKRAANLAKRRDVLAGTNQYANATETPLPADATDYEALYRERAAQMAHYRTHDDDPTVHQIALERLSQMLSAAPEEMVETAIAAAEAGATLSEITRTLRVRDEARPTIVPLPLGRASEPFEALRARALSPTLSQGARESDPLILRERDGARESDPLALRERDGERGKPPRLFLANLGPPRQHKARADFTQGFFEVGGFQVLTNNGFKTPAEAAAAALDSGAPAVVICSTDETYPELAPPLVAAIKAESPETVVLLAGRPAEQLDALRAAGIDEFIYLGADVVAVNNWLLDKIAEG
ncbi:methylmalonyl-CoA mutase family protein [Promineifilum sp.]|uniref:methylmalonyl-CoA mutase family protein n=1 Tax=Promineifilum sp. TaxID=2664178 RepID=UPI0035B15C3B